MQGILELIPQWASLTSLLACAGLFLGIIIHQFGNRNHSYSEAMRAMPLRDDDAVHIADLHVQRQSSDCVNGGVNSGVHAEKERQ